jgi:hypothetical protein
MRQADALHYLKFKRGEALPQARLTEASVREARALHTGHLAAIKKLQAEYSAKALANRYGVHHRTMEKALAGETWRHIL